MPTQANCWSVQLGLRGERHSDIEVAIQYHRQLPLHPAMTRLEMAAAQQQGLNLKLADLSGSWASRRPSGRSQTSIHAPSSPACARGDHKQASYSTKPSTTIPIKSSRRPNIGCRRLGPISNASQHDFFPLDWNVVFGVGGGGCLPVRLGRSTSAQPMLRCNQGGVSLQSQKVFDVCPKTIVILQK